MSRLDVEKPIKIIPPQHQRHQPGDQEKMLPEPRSEMKYYQAAGKLEGKRALITGGDSGIGRATAIGFAKEGADVAIVYLEEDQDAEHTKELVEAEGRRCLLIRGDVADQAFCKEAVAHTIKEMGGLDILVNNAAQQIPADGFEKLDMESMERTFRINIFSQFYLAQAALPHLKKGSSIINTASVTAYQGFDMIDCAATKGAIVTFTRALSQELAKKGIRVNAVAPGPIWTPLIPASMKATRVTTFGHDTPLGRPGQPDEVAPCFIFLASDDASYITGQVLHPNGGEMVNG